MTKECIQCKRFFHNPDEFFCCWICFKKTRSWDLTKGDGILDAHISEFDKLYREHLKLQSDPPKFIVKRILSLDDIAKNRVKQLIRLCHPDKHTNSQNSSAVEVTSWLLKIKRKMS